MRYATLLLCLLPMACAPSFPDLDDRLTAQSQAADYPRLVPLEPLLASAEAPAPRAAATEGASLEARLANLQRRADWLRNMPL
ncbi:hypothetical protein [Gymnodinialimonas ulvae]|uniref:hypothetical protein n=1 Tax=Gymnodinialimonas ulvae TaxID=3126504 RepID=UPI0030B7E231